MDLSIIIPVKNGANTIERALSSLILCNDIEYEIIVVDNMSVDSTLELTEKWALENVVNATIIECKKKGAPAARNQGLSLAKGKWIQFLDADDELIGHKVSERITLTKMHGFQILLGSFVFNYARGNNTPLLDKIHPINIISESIGITSSNLYLKGIVEQVGGWDERLTSSQEADLLFRCFLAGASIGKFPEACCVVHTDATSRISNSSLRMRLNNYAFVRSRFVSSYSRRNYRLELALYRSIFNFDAPLLARLHLISLTFFRLRTQDL